MCVVSKNATENKSNKDDKTCGNSGRLQLRKNISIGIGLRLSPLLDVLEKLCSLPVSLIVATLASMGIGMLWIRKIVNIED